ncbi:hypothetical protein ARMGADRAFT_77749 [Armillaria gallica]|uniref:F-box domain-containing protein n=1 Tax=Armillaria gallica TaxID=47427 RepID=A0A2H3CEZ2_ARMGA|nr:hypothetical protein ARMGADRAFT_77749 [Armillaria gallica]
MARSHTSIWHITKCHRTTPRSLSFPIRRLCPYIISEILGWCSPADLVGIRGLSKDFKAFLDSKPHGSLCWKRARANVSHLPPPPTFPHYNLDEHAYAAFLFNVYQTPCFCCGQATNGTFPNVMYRVYLCGRPACSKQFESESQGHLFTYHGDKELIRKYAPIMPALPYNLSPSGQKLFMVQHAKQQLKEYHRYIATRGTKLWTEKLEQKRILRHLLNNNSSALYPWMTRYYKSAHHVQRSNKEL